MRGSQVLNAGDPISLRGRTQTRMVSKVEGYHKFRGILNERDPISLRWSKNEKSKKLICGISLRGTKKSGLSYFLFSRNHAFELYLRRFLQNMCELFDILMIFDLDETFANLVPMLGNMSVIFDTYLVFWSRWFLMYGPKNNDIFVSRWTTIDLWFKKKATWSKLEKLENSNSWSPACVWFSISPRWILMHDSKNMRSPWPQDPIVMMKTPHDQHMNRQRRRFPQVRSGWGREKKFFLKSKEISKFESFKPKRKALVFDAS